MKFERRDILGLVLAIATLGALFLLDGKILKTGRPTSLSKNITQKALPLPNPPKIIRAIYFTASSAGNQTKIDYLIRITQETQINAVVIDIKDPDGHVVYDTGLPEIEKYKTSLIVITDLNTLLQKLHADGIYVIARIVVFQDPAFANARPDLAVKNGQRLWTDNKGLAWMDPAAKDVWDYNIALTKDAASRGFDEINFDYVRFPTDGNLQTMSFPLWDKNVPMREILSGFFEKLRTGLPDTRLSVDLFGFAMTQKKDLGIGQVLEDAFKYFDFISPMVYPSHYPDTYLGFAKPAEHPYEVIKNAMDKGLKRLNDFEQTNPQTRKVNFRPWLQDFNLRGVPYDAVMVKAEMKAVTDSLGDTFGGFMFWNAGNIYTENAFH